MKDPFERLGVFIGGMRCGSTAVNDYLKQHLEVCIHRRKDPHFFSGDENWQKGWSHYLEGWSHFDRNHHRVVFDSSTHYTKFPMYPETAKRLASAPWDVRLIYGIQSPIARIESHFIHNAGKGYLDSGASKQREGLLRQAIKVSNYDLQISQYERYFTPNQIMILRTKDLISDPDDVLASVCRHLGVDDSFEFERIPRRERKFRHDVSHARLTDQERAKASAALREPVRRFEQRYGVTIWDGEE